MTYNEVLTAARGQMGPCKACPVCDGRACRNTVPGPGAKGVGDVAIRNYSAWQNVRVNMDTICESGEPDTTLEMFGHSYRIPVFAGPVGAMQLHYGDKYNDLDYNNILVPACAAAGIAAFTGDGTDPAVMEGAAAAIAKFSAGGKVTKKKDLGLMAMSYGYVYVATVAMGANPAQTIKAITEAEAYHGPSLIIGYSPCEMHSIKGGMVNCQKEMKRAVECGYWNMFRFNPALKAEGKNPFTIDSKQPVTEEYRNFLLNEARYSSLTRSFPERAEKLFGEAEVKSVERYEHLLRLKDLYAPKAD